MAFVPIMCRVKMVILSVPVASVYVTVGTGLSRVFVLKVIVIALILLHIFTIITVFAPFILLE